MDHVARPRNVGEVAAADGVGQMGNSACGDVIRITLKVAADDRLADVKFKAFGCGAAVAAASVVTVLARGKTVEEAAHISAADVAEALGGLPVHKAHCSHFATDALQLALEDYSTRRGLSSQKARGAGDAEKGVLVGLSGGVDSAVAALLLGQRGFSVHTTTLKLWASDDERSCCSSAAVDAARSSARALGVPHSVDDARAAFAESVVHSFVRGYEAGETPNPCVLCNPQRLEHLVRLADRLGLGHIATGHYARLVSRDGRPYVADDEARGGGRAEAAGGEDEAGLDEAQEGPFVARGRDRAKDQSYMLWRVQPATLRRLLLPLGELRKDEVRALAAQAALPVANRPESQEVCFAPRDYRDFLAARGARCVPGDIVTRAGHRLGTHQGQWRYTIGQRRGLGVSADQPLYVLERRAATNEVVVGTRVELATVSVEISDLHDRGLATPSGALLEIDQEVGAEAGLQVQLRYKAGAIGVRRLRRLAADRARLTLAQPFAGVAPGQSAVFYRDDVVVGGGIITQSSE
jgi:tRNA-specific 2-thiouridylase